MNDQPTASPNGDDRYVRAAIDRLRRRVDEHDGQLENLGRIVRDLEDALVVHAHLEKRMTEQIKEHAQLIVSHEDFVRFHDMKMREIDEKLDALINIVMRREGGPEAHS